MRKIQAVDLNLRGSQTFVTYRKAVLISVTERYGLLRLHLEVDPSNATQSVAVSMFRRDDVISDDELDHVGSCVVDGGATIHVYSKDKIKMTKEAKDETPKESE